MSDKLGRIARTRIRSARNPFRAAPRRRPQKGFWGQRKSARSGILSGPPGVAESVPRSLGMKIGIPRAEGPRKDSGAQRESARSGILSGPPGGGIRSAFVGNENRNPPRRRPQKGFWGQRKSARPGILSGPPGVAESVPRSLGMKIGIPRAEGPRKGSGASGNLLGPESLPGRPAWRNPFRVRWE